MQQPDQPAEKQSPSSAKSSFVSFVSFDTNPTQEARKAVRKQAALASAAARKATIARKIAKQKESAQSGQPDEGRKGTKRKRSPVDSAAPKTKKSLVKQTVAESVVRPVKAFTNCISLYEDAASPAEEQTAYLSPEPSLNEEEKLVGACECAKCSRAIVKPSTPWLGAQWPVLSEDYCKLETVPMLSTGPYSIASSQVNPFCRYPVEYHPIFDKLLHHLLTVFAPRGWPTLKITRAEGLEWEGWMTVQAFREPAFFYVRLLFACGDLIRVGQLDPKVADWLRTLAIGTINEALSDPERSISDGLILAVGRIALTESMYGDREAASRLHRPAQKRMIDLRGGMDALPFPALVKKLMRWADNVMAIQSGTERILGEDVGETEQNYGVKKSVDVLEKWVPQEGRALRKKIAISDLIT